MPGVYVANRSDAPGRAGLTMPYTPTKGPILLAVNPNNLLDVGQDEPVNMQSSELVGIRTAHMSECSVVIIAESTGSSWGRIYFNHIGGSDIRRADESLKEYISQIGVQQHCCSAILANSRNNADGLARALHALKFPLRWMSVYVSSTDTTEVGYVVSEGFFGEISSSTRHDGKAPYGHLGQVGKVRIF